MNTRIKIACAVSLLISVSAPGLARAQGANVASLLNTANQMNNEEQDEAKELHSKAGDNQALVTMADTLTQDHKANQSALDVPPECGLTVGGVPGTWTPGRCVVFDDAFVHDAWNDSDRERVVLIVDLWHPDLSDDEVALLEGLHGHVAGHAANLRSYWARNDEARRAAP